MRLIIDISDNLYDVIKYDKYGLHKGKLYDIIRDGIPLIEEKSLRVENNLTIEKYQQEPRDDTISRQAVMDALCDECELFHRNGEQTCLTKCESYHFLATLPPVYPQNTDKGDKE